MANEVVINVNADVARAKAGFKDLKGRMEDFSKKARGAGIALSAMGAAGALAIKDFVGAAMEQERAIKTLASSVESTGVSFDTVKAKIMDTTAALQDKTNFGDEAQIRTLTILTTILGDVDQAMAALPAVMDASAASGLKMESVAKTMGKALAGQVHQADSVGIKFDQTADFGERLAQVLGKVGGAAEADVDPFQQLGNDLGDLKETIGSALIPILLPLVDGLRSIFKRLQDMNPALLKAGAVALALATGLGLIGGPILLIISMIPALVAGIGMVTAAWVTLAGATGIGLVVIAVGLLAVLFVTKFDLIKTTVSDALNFIIQKIVEWGQKIAPVFDFIIEMTNKLTGTSLPLLSDKLEELGNVTLDWGGKAEKAADAAHEHMDVAAASVEKVGDAAVVAADKVGNVLEPEIVKLGKSASEGLTPYLEYGKRLERMKVPMEDLTDEADKLSKKFGITMSDAIDYIANIKMAELDSAQREFAEGLLAPDGVGGAIDKVTEKITTMDERLRAFVDATNKSMAVHTEPTDLRGGSGALANDPLGIKAAFFAGGGKVVGGQTKEPAGLPAGLQGQGTLSGGVELIAAHGRGDISAAELRAALAGLTIKLDGKQLDSSGGDYGAYNDDIPPS